MREENDMGRIYDREPNISKIAQQQKNVNEFQFCKVFKI